MSHSELFEEVERYELREAPPYTFRPTRREFVEAIGAGLLIIATRPVLEAQSGGSTLEARLHIGEDGRITILSGKIEEGQGARTELAIAAAEELRIPVDQVKMVLADTDIVPNDGTTAGSRTTPSTVPLVRKAAAAARELLATVSGQQNKKLTYADLAKSPELAKVSKQPLPADVKITPAKDWQVLGQPQNRINGADIVTGAHKFPSDIQRPGMLYGTIVRPPSYGATLESFDVESGTSLNGVLVVRDGEFIGCAGPTSFETRRVAEGLAGKAKWKEKQHPSSDNLFAHLKSTARGDDGGGRSRPKVAGDVTAALAKATKPLKATYTAAYVQHAPMEPRAAVAEWQDGKLTVWTGTSNPFSVRQTLAETFRIPIQRVRVIAPDFGGGFGGKHTGEAAIEAARLAKEAGAPVSLRWTRAEEFTWAYSRPAALIEVEGAVDSNGIAAWDFTNYNSGGSAIDTPYKAANVRIRYVPSDSPLRQGSYRALASTANNFARECFMDELAATTGMDALAFRLAHLDNDRIREVLLAATKKFGWEERRIERRANRGVGLACGTEKNSVVAACVEVEVDPKTGAPKLLEIVEAYECGAILNPANLKAQVEGCIVMGLGAVLREQILFADGKLKNPRFSQYRVPRFRDVPPKMDIVLIDKKESEPIGAGETPIIAVAPAMANAIFNVTGKRVRSMPFTATA